MLVDFFQPQLQKLAHYILKWSSLRGYRRFDWATKHILQAQQQCFNSIIYEIHNTPVGHKFGLKQTMSIAEFQQKIPVSNYHDWKWFIKKQYTTHKPVLSNSPCNHYQPSSGSTSTIKWIPYTKSFLSQLEQATAVWIWDIYTRYPLLTKGRYYCPSSCIPFEFTPSINNNLNLLPGWKRMLIPLLTPVPKNISQAKASEESWFKTLCYLAADSSLVAISVWSPTFALDILKGITKYHKDIASTLNTGQWPTYFNYLNHPSCPTNARVACVLINWDGKPSSQFIHTLWPKLTLISAWDTSTSEIWAKQLQQYISFSDFQGKGSWTAEGIVTFPLQGKYPLAINSHFYEFIDTDSGKLYLPWELKLNQKVQPLLTTGSGLLRYAIKDQLQVVDFINQCPCFTFLRRIDNTDMVGEKLSTEIALNLLKQFKIYFNRYNIKPLCLIAVPTNSYTNKPYYVLLCSSENDYSLWCEEIQQFLENFLSNHFHYQLARNLKQLESSRLVISSNAWEIYRQHGQRQGISASNLKVEPLLVWDNHIPEEFQKNNDSSPKKTGEMDTVSMY